MLLTYSITFSSSGRRTPSPIPASRCLARSWVTEASNAARPFDRLPKLDGTLLLDEESRRAIAIDQGNMFHRVPAAVLRPGSVQDIVVMLRYANQHKLKVAVRGNGHSRYGQTQAEAGVVIDSRSLNAVRVRTPHSADAQLGALWSAVADAMLPKGVTPRLFPGTCLGLLTVGGTLNAGGIGLASPHYGALVDNVTASMSLPEMGAFSPVRPSTRASCSRWCWRGRASAV
jgi:cytokinin dehydrogenase